MAKFLNGDGLSRLVALTKQALSGKQDTLVSGTNIKTINNTSLLSSGNLDLTKKVEYFTKADMDADTSQPNGTIGYDGDNEVWYIFDQPNGEWKRIDIQNPNEIASITTSESSVSGGNNSVTITETNGTTHTFNVKNGVDGANGVSLGDVEIADNMTTDDATKVLSARQGKMIGDDLSRLRDYEFGTRTYTDSDLLKDKCTTTNTNPIDGIIRPQPDCGAMKFPITKGDKLTIATNGGSGARAYCLTDTSGTNPVLVSASNLNTTSNPVTIDVEQDGYCYINCKSASYEDFSIVHYYSLERQMLEDNTRSLTQGEMQGTSQWIRDKLVGLGWEFEMYLKSNGTTAVFSGHCVTPFIELPSSVAGHNLTFGFMFVGNSSCSIAFYNSSKAFTSGHYIGTNGYTDTRTVDINSGWTADAYVRMTCNPARLSECYIFDNTTGEYIWKGSDYLGNVYEDNLVSYATFRDVLLTQESGDKTNVAMSQKAITDAIQHNVSIKTGTSIQCGEDYSSGTFFLLTDKQVSLLNNTDIISWHFVVRNKFDAAYKNGEWVYLRASLFTTSVEASSSGQLNKIDNAWLNKNGSTNYSIYPDVFTVVYDRINGVCRLYNKTTLVQTVASTSFEKDSFVDATKKVLRLCSGGTGNNGTRFYDVAIYDYDISQLFGISASAFPAFENSIQGAHTPNVIFEDVYKNARQDGAFVTMTSTYGSGTGWTITNNDAIRTYKNTTTTNNLTAGYYIGNNKRARRWETDLEVISGVVKITTSNTVKVYDSNGNEVADINNIGVGTYCLKGVACTVGCWAIARVSGDVEVKETERRYKPISCVVHIRCDALYDGKIYDDQVDYFYPKQENVPSSATTGWNYSTKHNPIITDIPLRTTKYSLTPYPHYDGEMAIVSGNVYIGMPDYTWKQINNS